MNPPTPQTDKMLELYPDVPQMFSELCRDLERDGNRLSSALNGYRHAVITNGDGANWQAIMQSDLDASVALNIHNQLSTK